MNELVLNLIICSGFIICFLIVEIVFYFLRKMDKQNVWNHYQSIERKISVIEQKDSVNFNELGNVQREFKNLQTEFRNLQIEVVKIQTRLEERQSKQSELPQLSLKPGPGRPPKVLAD